jgi:hypothetical protein
LNAWKSSQPRPGTKEGYELDIIIKFNPFKAINDKLQANTKLEHVYPCKWNEIICSKWEEKWK